MEFFGFSLKQFSQYRTIDNKTKIDSISMMNKSVPWDLFDVKQLNTNRNFVGLKQDRKKLIYIHYKNQFNWKTVNKSWIKYPRIGKSKSK